jgi:hypothetical protein
MLGTNVTEPEWSPFKIEILFEFDFFGRSKPFFMKEMVFYKVCPKVFRGGQSKSVISFSKF